MIRAKHVLKILSINAAVLAFGIVIIELLFGGWLDESRLNRLNLIKDRTFKYDASNLYNSPNPIITYSRDNFGLRGNHSAPGRIDILTVGGSTTDQRYICDGETWQDALEDQFQTAGATVKVANAGIDGQSTFGHIKNFKWWFDEIPGLAPDYILFYVGLNDFHKDAGYKFDDLLGEEGSFSLKRILRENSALLYLARTVRGIYEARVHKLGHRSVDFDAVTWTRQPLQYGYDFMLARLDAYDQRLRMLADMTHQFGSKPIFVTQPTRQYRVTSEGVEGIRSVRAYDGHQINGVDVHNMMKRFDSVMEAVSDEKGAIFIDLASDANWADADFYDYSHMTPQGARKVGNLLYEELRDIIPDKEQVGLWLRK